MEQEILTVAKCVTNATAEEETYLSTLCSMEAARLKARLKEPLTEENRSAFVCAAAWMAAADFFGAKGASGAASWSAGEVSVHEREASAYGTTSENLRKAATALMAEHLRDLNFVFLGVKG